MTTGTVLDREEYIEQAYFFRVLRERLESGQPTQDVLERIDQEILSITRLPYAIQFLAAELKHTGQLSSGFTRLPHYFTPFQAFVIRGTEAENLRFSLDRGLLVLQREAEYRAGQPTPAGLFIYEFEVLSRSRLGYDEGLRCMAQDVFYGPEWRVFFDVVRRQVGLVDFADLLFWRSEWFVHDQRRNDPQYQPPQPTLLGEKEGKIAKANSGRDPLYLFAALQRQLNYPEVPRPQPRDDVDARMLALQARVRELEKRIKLLESEARGKIDLSEFGTPDILQDADEADEK
jgi:hypothetical protein